jgi:hypothetical protein
MSAHPPTSSERPSFALRFVRWYFPLAVIAGGIIAFLANPSVLAAEGAAGVIGAGLAWLLFGWLYRQGEQGDHERDVEDAARTYFDEHGEWPSDRQYASYERSGRWSGSA